MFLILPEVEAFPLKVVQSRAKWRQEGSKSAANRLQRAIQGALDRVGRLPRSLGATIWAPFW